MSVLGGNPLLLGSGDAAGFTTQRSVRLRSSASAYFGRTFTTPTNNIIWTWSAWVKRGTFGTAQQLMGAGTSGTGADQAGISLQADNSFLFYQTQTGTGTFEIQVATTQVLRDPSAWYHIVVSYDSAQGTSANRVKIYINGVQVTAFATATYPTSSLASRINAARSHDIGRYGSGVNYFDGYLTEVNFIDGQALTPSSFGEYDAVRNTQWKPKRYTGTYGTNGFYLNFSDNSNNTAATIGKDSSGNGNNWTPIGISVAATTLNDSMKDVPTFTSENASNFATLNPLNSYGGVYTPIAGNLYYNINVAAWASVTSTIGMTSGKYYFEFISGNVSQVSVGIANISNNYIGVNVYVGQSSTSYGYSNGALRYNNASGVSYGATYTSNDVIGVAFDADAGTLTFYKNNVSQGVAYSSIPSGTYCFAISLNNCAGFVNFGQQPFTYTPPTGFLALNTYNLPDGNVTSSDDYHKIYTYTGNGGGLQVGEIQKPASLFNLDRSLRFRSSNSAYLSRTPASAGNRQKWTWSGWVKRSGLGAEQVLFHAYNGSNPVRTVISFTPSDQITFNIADGGYDICTTTQVFRDPAAWFHLCVSLDSTQATPADRLTIEVNGVAVAYSSSVSLNRNGDINTTNLHHISSYGSASFLNGYLADVYFVDGQKLTASNFGTYDGNYYWTPKAYTGTYGTNGFHLEFEDFSAATAAAIGKDTSGNVNNWTPNNINLTTPENTNVSWDSMVDVPTLTSADVANFATFNPLNNATTLTNGNLTASGTANTGVCATLEIPPTGLFYWEVTATTVVAGGNTLVGMIATNQATTVRDGTVAGIRVVARSDGLIQVDATTVQSGLGSWASGDVIGCAYNATTNSLQFYRNNFTFGTAVTPTSGYTFVPWCCSVVSGTSVFNINFGQRQFRYTPPTDFKDLNSFNIAEVLGDVETPDFVWIKSRSAGTNHALFNSVIGVGRYGTSVGTTTETTDVNSLIQFNKNGFLLGNSAIANTLSATYVASAWKIAATTVTNNNGTISSQVRANPTIGTSVVTYTGNGIDGSTIANHGGFWSAWFGRGWISIGAQMAHRARPTRAALFGRQH